MDAIVSQLVSESQSAVKSQFEAALSDLRFVIERYTMNRFSNEEEDDYLKLFYNKTLIHYTIDRDDLELVKFILIFLLFNFPDRAVLTAKCIKVLFDTSINEAICTGVETYMRKDDSVTSELLYAITNAYEDQSYLSNKRILGLFKDVLINGGSQSREIVDDELKLYQKSS